MVIETDRLILRPWEDADAPELRELAHDPDVAARLGSSPHASEPEVPAAVRSAERRPESYAVIDRRTGELLGSASLTSADPRSRTYELEFWIGVPFRSYGYATEAARTLVRRAVAELGATRVRASCRADDARAQAVLEACGLVRTDSHESDGSLPSGQQEPGAEGVLRFELTLRRTVFIDADACPVTREALDCAREAGVPVVIAGNTTQNLERHIRREDPRDAAQARRGFWVDVLDVSVGADSADFAIVERLSPGDVVVTQDIGLASMALGRDARAVSVRGHVFRKETIDAELLVRHEEKRVRRAGGRTRGPRAFTTADRRRFSASLRRLLGGEGARA